MSREDTDLIIDFMNSQKNEFEKFLREERGLSPHAAIFIIEDLEYELTIKHHG